MKELKLKSHGILHYFWSADLSKSFSESIVSIFTFFRYIFLTDFVRWKSLWLAHNAYTVID